MKARLIIHFTIGAVCLMAGGSLYGQDTRGLTDTAPLGQARTASGDTHGGGSYTIQKGDCLAKILREEFKLPDDIIFSPRTHALLAEANPGLPNLNDLQAGEQLIVPAILVRQQPQGAAGSVEKNTPEQQPREQRIGPHTPSAPAIAAPRTPVAKTPGPDPPADTESEHAPAQALASESDDMPIQEISIASADTLDREKKTRKLLSSFATAFGGLENATCDKTLEVENAGAFTLDCSKFPVYEFPWGNKIILDYGERLPASLQKILSSAWNQTEIISVPDSAAAKSVLGRAIEVCGLQKLESGNRYTISRDDAQITVTGDWIVFKESEHKNIYIISVDDGPSLPDALKKYLAKLGIDFIFLTDHRAIDCPTAESSSGQSDDRRPDPAAFTDAVLDLAGIAYQRNVKTKLIPRHEIGITLELSTDRKFLVKGKPCFIVFKNISDNMVNLFQNQGYKVLHIDRYQPLSSETVQNLLNFVGLKNTVPTANFQYDHSNTTAIKISFPGFLLQTKKGDVLLTNTKIDSDIVNFITYSNIKIIYF